MKKRLLTLLLLIAPMLTFAQEKGLAEKINEGFKPVADAWGGLVFYPIKLGGGVEMPLVIIMLLAAGLIFTIVFKFVNIRLFPTSINIVRGEYDDIDHATSGVMAGDPTPGGDVFETIAVEGAEGEVSHFQALTAALSATVGLGNIAGVAVAVSLETKDNSDVDNSPANLEYLFFSASICGWIEAVYCSLLAFIKGSLAIY